MTRGNGVVGVVRGLRSPDDVAPPSADLGAGGDRDDGAILMLEVLVAREVCVVDVLDRVVTVRGADALELTLVGPVDRYLLEYGMRGREGRRKAQERSRCDSHRVELN